MARSWHGSTFSGTKKVYIRTNLDLAFAEGFGHDFIIPPAKGDDIRSSFQWPNGFRLTLRVVAITHCEDGVEVELHLPPRYPNLVEFYRVYEHVTGEKFI